MFLKRLQVLLNCCYALSPRVAATCIARDRRGDAWLTALVALFIIRWALKTLVIMAGGGGEGLRREYCGDAARLQT